MCSASSARTRSRMATATSTINRSAPRPERSTASAWAMSAAWVTVAPFSIAILVAVVSWPLSVPTIRSRMTKFLCLGGVGRTSIAFRLDDFGHCYAELFLDQDHFAAGNQPVVDVDVDRLADLAVKFEDAAGAEFEQVVDFHARAPEHRGNLHRNVEDSLELAGDARRRSFGLGRRHRHVGGAIFEVGQRY